MTPALRLRRPSPDAYAALLRLAAAFAFACCAAGCEYRPVDGGGRAAGRKLAVVFVDETADLLTGRGKYRTGREFHAALRGKGHVWRYVDDDVTDPRTGRAPADVAPFIDHARTAGVPRVYLNDVASGRCLWSGKPPADPEVLLETIRSLGG